ISDYEATDYKARLNGVLVQSYWSQRDDAFIVPGTRQNFYVGPVTEIDASGNPVVWRTLIVFGNQLAGSWHDTITVDVSGDDIVVTENNETVQIPKDQLDRVVIESGNGNDAINVEATKFLPVIINLGIGATVNISPTARSLDTIQSAVFINSGG